MLSLLSCRASLLRPKTGVKSFNHCGKTNINWNKIRNFTTNEMQGKSIKNTLNKEKLIVGFDINSRSTGYSVLNERGESISYGIIDTSDENGIFAKGLAIRQKMKQLKSDTQNLLGPEVEIEWIPAVEEFLNRVSVGHIKIVIMLAQINSLVSYDCHQVFGKLPLRFEARDIRKYFELPTRTEKGADKSQVKVAALQFVKKSFLPELEIVLNRNGRVKDGNFDVSDATLVAHYALNHLLKEKEKPVVEVIETEKEPKRNRKKKENAQDEEKKEAKKEKKERVTKKKEEINEGKEEKKERKESVSKPRKKTSEKNE